MFFEALLLFIQAGNAARRMSCLCSVFIREGDVSCCPSETVEGCDGRSPCDPALWIVTVEALKGLPG
jgi:hypothetical protein